MGEERFIDSAIRKALGHQLSRASSSCPDENLLAAYLERSLSDQEKSRLETHVSDCASCRDLLALSMKAAGDEPMSAGETGSSRERMLLFRFSVPAAAVAALVLGIGIGTLFLLNRELGKPDRTEVAQQTSPAPVSRPVPQARRDSSASPVAPEKDSTPRQAPAQVARMDAAADEMNRAKSKEGRAEARPAPAYYAHPPEPERKLSMSDRIASNEAAEKPAEWRGEIQADAAKAAAGVETGSAKVTGATVGGVVGGILPPARPVEEPAAREVAPQAAVLTADSGGVKTEAQDRVAKMAVKSRREALSTASTSLAESRLRDIIRGVAADEKAGKRPDAATRVIGGRTFELHEGFWVDLKCLDNPDAELIECKQGSPGFDEVLKNVPGLVELRRDGLPILLDWNGKIRLIR